MSDSLTQPEAEAAASFDTVDVAIIGAGISGIDAARHLRERHPGLSFAIVEKQAEFGGTWRTHRFPGIRSDSDLYTFGFAWKPWLGPAIATREEILAYLGEAIEETGLAGRIRYGLELHAARWSSAEARWLLEMRDAETGAPRRLACRFLWMCQGYYRHEQGYTPGWEGMERFGGRIVHPQTWPENLDLDGRRVVVIGSGATAATLIPAIAGRAAHVTMLQRSPTYFFPRPSVNELADRLRALDVPDEWLHEIMRRNYLAEQKEVRRRAKEEPDALAADLIGAARAMLGPDYDIDTHFRPRYRPWRQRIAMVPDGDFFAAIRAGRASVETDEIERFTETGLALASGRVLEADVIVTATGLDLLPLGGVAFEVDGAALDVSEAVTYRGMMFSGAPNLAWVFGYLRSSWTLRADLVSDYVCRLLSHMAATGTRAVTPTLLPEEREMPRLPFIDPENFNAGYVMRALDRMPKQGDRAPWTMTQDFEIDRVELPAAPLDDPRLVYS